MTLYSPSDARQSKQTLFTLHRAAKAYGRGQRAKPRLNTMLDLLWGMTACAIIIPLAWVIFLIVLSLITDSIFLASAPTITGRIHDIVTTTEQVSTRYGSPTTNFTYAVSFTYFVDGQRYTGTEWLQNTLPDHFRIGWPVTVHYAADRPPRSTILSEVDAGRLGFTLIPLVAAIGLGLSARKIIRKWRFAHRGTLLDGTIAAISGARYPAHSTGAFLVTIEYAFISPSGIPLHGRAKAQRTDLSKNPQLPDAGTQVKVLYLSDTLHTVV